MSSGVTPVFGVKLMGDGSLNEPLDWLWVIRPEREEIDMAETGTRGVVHKPSATLPLVSVIVPAYNAEEFIGAALESIVAQDYEKIEIIVVNDASTDATPDVARGILASGARPYELVEWDVNRGVSAARNAGMDIAAGEFITFVDSDDLIDSNYISTMYKAMSDSSADIAVCGYRSKTGCDGHETSHSLDISGWRNKPLVFAKKTIAGDTSIYFGASVYRKNLLAKNGLRFTEGCVCGEDAELFIKAIAMSGNIVFSDKCSYVYRIHSKMGSRSGHATHEQNAKRYSDLVQGRIRAGHFIMEQSRFPLLVDAARYELLPCYYLKMFTMHAWRGDKEAFFSDLGSKMIKNILLSSRRAFFSKPQTLLKTLWLLAFPNMYYEYRRKHVYFYKV
jgi:glycosyltransferase involved in cell wall biosynthesis